MMLNYDSNQNDSNMRDNSTESTLELVNFMKSESTEEGLIESAEIRNENVLRDMNYMLYLMLGIFISIDLLICIPKYIILSKVLIDLFGGPDYIILPVILWCFCEYFCFYIISISRKSDYPSIYQSLQFVFTHMVKYSNSLRLGNFSAQSHELISDNNIVFSISSFEYYSVVIVSVIDIVITCITILFSFIIILVLFSEPDKLIVDGWSIQYLLLLVDIFIFSLSNICKVFVTVLLVIIQCRSNCAGDASRCIVSKNSKIFQFKAVVSLCCGLISLASFIYLSICIGSILKFSYFKNSIYDNCDNMVSKACSLPFPSFQFLEDDALTETGYRVNIPENTLPYTKRNKHMSGKYMNKFDGYSVSGSLLWHLPGIREDQLVNYQSISSSMLLNSTSLLIDINRNIFFPHFTELDYLNQDSDKIAYIQSATSMQYNTHYLVVIQGLTISANSSQLIPRSPLLSKYFDIYFSNGINLESLLDSNEADIKRYYRFQSKVFPLLQTLGLNFSSIQLIWDFHTASKQSLLQSLSGVYDSTLKIVAKHLDLSNSDIESELNHFAFNYENSSYGHNTSENQHSVLDYDTSFEVKYQSSSLHRISEDIINNGIYRELTVYPLLRCKGYEYGDPLMVATFYYRINVPWFLKSLKRVNNHILTSLFDIDSVEKINNIPFTGDVGLFVIIPCSIFKGYDKPTALIEFGHGIFGNRKNANFWFLTEQAVAKNWIIWSMDWRGFTNFDLPAISRVLMYDIDESTHDLESSIVQGYSSKLAGRFIMRYILSHEKVQYGISKDLDVSAEALPAKFIGESMGSILGGGYTAFAGYSQAVFLVSGSPFMFLLTRSDVFKQFYSLLAFQFYNAIDVRIALTSLQLFFDAGESSGWKHADVYQQMSTLSEIALGDSRVSPIAGRIMALNLNSTQTSPSLFPIFGMNELKLSVAKHKGLNILNQGIFTADFALLPKNNELPEISTNVHLCLDTIPQIQFQVMEFLSNNTIFNICGNNGCVYGETAIC